MTTAVQHRRGTTAEHSTFTGLEGEVTIDTTKDTAVIHDGSLAGGYPLAKETLANVNPSTLSAITGAATASDDLFLMYDTSALAMKKMTRAELNNAITIEALDTVDINGGTIDGTTIGGTTPAAGAFTTLSASGAVTLSGGTANGVPYLNGSKVLTSGSALTFDGTSLQAAAARGTYALKIYNSSDGSVAGNFGALTGNVFAIDATGPANTMTFLTGGSEQMRLTSTGLGIGTSSPTTKLYVTASAASTACAAFFNTDTANGNGVYIKAGGANAGKYALAIDNAASSSLLYLDSYGNLGIGTSSPAAKLDVAGTAAISGAVTLSGGTANGVPYLNGSKVLTSGSALTFDGANLATTGSVSATKVVVSGATDSTNIALSGYVGGAFLNTPSGTSGYLAVNGTANYAWSSVQSIWYTSGSEAMRLTSTGLGIGTSSPAAPLEVIGLNGVFISRGSKTANANSGSRFMGGAYTGNPATAIFLDGRSGQNQLNIGGGTGVGEPATFIRFYTGTAGALGIGSEQMRLTSTGLGIGTSSPVARLHVEDTSSAAATALVRLVGQNTYQMDIESLANGAGTVGNRFNFAVNSSGGEFSWSNSGGERLRIDSSGYLRLSSNSGGIQFNGDTAAANALDDYEEGTWTPVLSSAGGTPSGTAYTNRNAAYTKIGRVVTVIGGFELSAKGTGGSGEVYVTGLPFVNSSTGGFGEGAGAMTIGYLTTASYNSRVTCFPAASGAYLRFRLNENDAQLDLSQITNTTYIKFTATYFV